MAHIARGVLAGIAIGGFAAVIVKTNLIVLKALGEFNNLAVDMALVMGRAAWREIKLQRLCRQLAVLAVGEIEKKQAEKQQT